jgi:hypothetical protein
MTPRIGGGPSGRPTNETLAETGPGLPDEAIGPEQRTIREQTDLAAGRDAERMARKLAAEAVRDDVDDDAALQDPTGHA